jgi:ketosteroid isomerase-like protein
VSGSDRIRLARAAYDAYVTGDRSALEDLLSEDFTFYSPYDVGIDRRAYFERCWPNAKQIAGYEFTRLVESGDEVIVTYEGKKVDGKRFRNTEVLTFAGDKLRRAEVYFGWDV